MNVYSTLIVMIVASFFISCGGSSSGADPRETTQTEVQFSGTLPQLVGVDSTFSDTLEYVNGKIGTVGLGEDKPDWVDVKTNSNNKQIIIYGKAPAEASSYDVTLKITGDPINSGESKFGLSFTMSVIDLQ